MTAKLETEDRIYRGDAGNAGGHVFVLETRPWHRVAHVHVVEYEGSQWRNYLRFGDLLRNSPKARQKYKDEKLRLDDRHRDDRKAYANGKTEIVTKPLSSIE